MDSFNSIEKKIKDDKLKALEMNLNKELDFNEEEEFKEEIESGQEFELGITQKGQNFVNYEINYTSSDAHDGEGDQEAQVILTFSNKERPATNLGNPQGAHCSALALSLDRIIMVINRHFPVKKHNYEGLNALIGELFKISQQDNFFLRHFFPSKNNEEDYDKKNIFILGQYGKAGFSELSMLEIFNELENEQKMIDQRIEMLERIKSSLSAVKIDAETLKDLNELKDLISSHHSRQRVADFLKKASDNTKGAELSVVLLDQVKQLELDLKMDYCASITTKVARKIIEFQNKTPWTTFLTIPPRNDKERKFNNSESSRVTIALKALRQYPVVQLNDDQLITYISNLLYYPKVSNEYHDSSINLYNDTANRHFPSKNKKNKQRGPIPKINRRTNDETIFCYVVSRHLATIFSTFTQLNDLENKDEIIMAVVDKIMSHDNEGATLKWDFNPKKSTEIKNKIIMALKGWQEKFSVKIDLGELDFSAVSIENINILASGEEAHLSELGSSAKREQTAALSPKRQTTNLLSASSSITTTPTRVIHTIRGSTSPTQDNQSIGMTTPITNKSSSASKWMGMASFLKSAGGKSTSSTQHPLAQINASPVLAFEWARKNVPGANEIRVLVNKCSKENLSSAAISAVNLVGTTAKQGLVNGLNQLARPSCSLDGTTIISMMRPRY